MTHPTPEKVFDEARRFANYVTWRLREVIAIIMAIGSIGWGISVIVFPGGMANLHGFFTATISWASPQMWGAMLIVAAVPLGPAMLLVPSVAVFPAALLSLVYAALSASMVANTFEAAPVPTGAWAYAMLSAIAAALAWASVAERRE